MRTLTRTTTEERRRLPLSTAEVAIRATEGDGSASSDERFIGYAAKFNSRTAIGNPLRWGFYEEIAPGAFTKTLQEGDARMLIDHDSYYVVSRVSAGTLNLAEDAQGLPVDSALDPGLSYVNDLKTNVRNKNITGMSFGFWVVKDDWTLEKVETSDGQTAEVEVRRILEVRLLEVSAVTFPQYEDTEAELASVASALVRRGDQAAIERRAKYRPELRDLLQLVGGEAPAEDVAVAARTAQAAEERGALAVHSTGTSDAAWDGPANSSDLPGEEAALRMAHAWVDPDGDAAAKGSYRFIHHFVGMDGDVGAASTVACTTAIGVLNGARGGTTIPDEDREAVYKHLARHLKDAGIKAPELKAAGSEPGESTRESSTPEPAATAAATEPAETTRSDLNSRVLRMQGLAARYGLAAAHS
ncbi:MULTISPECIES: HK97 family phage prohead protease [Streptomyces]|uniref:HK97 family phage prohead protease n=1 Tax=Streptomyces TaxID=1883 RepID=UPI0029A6EE73|nr:HK97 family phage prohead protease [Streptomyces stelliscabiei]MDX2520586.1 HK97 family phage prohead protease [Streptomyces stelliscabiei]MDX2552683.1 HK97 family phage prohead protease [Streptomyces stelliscabiei]MDX2661367.1 HK97 family phage prohead protease [Streptomyces stelliscabiei]MDX2788848.1 HK97 family phage prohead protease [Streptomyces stelliscabiei]